MQYNIDELQHFGVKGMKWGVRKDDGRSSIGANSKIVKSAYSLGAKVAPREMSYSVKRSMNVVNNKTSELSRLAINEAKSTGVLSSNQNAMRAIEKHGIDLHKNKVYNNLNSTDISRLKTYTDSARFSRNVNSYLAIGDPKAYSDISNKLKQTISKNKIDDVTVYRSCNYKFTTNGLSKKIDNMSESELTNAFNSMSKNFSGKSIKENRIFSTSTSPLFAIDTWRKVNPTAAKSYNSYMIINCKGTSGLLADGRTGSGQKLVNTRSNQEAILAPDKLVYRHLKFDKARGMYAITVDAY